MLPDVVERKQALFLDRLDDRSLADAVAAANFGAVGHCCRLAVALVADVTDVRLTEQQVVAYLVDVLAVAQQLEVPRTVGGVAVEHATDEPVVLDHQLLVHAAGGVVEDDLLGILAAEEVTGGEKIDAGDLELG
ncbi:MAG: hypothetical protein AW09_004258 [Candidatus Accumulibacter phosphatis]|uniref:Uncharacterized protein n=1 Tax=Candidatus Accumulibacter phosphatis TaxID=327160 RepID=A0A080LSX8_9PROT|nr:MAG: hypothetical protein AW09_004258 [Candidatus Accumulibacter phosphatis]